MKLPQLSLRDQFWLVALVAMGCGWWVDRRSVVNERDRAIQEKDFILKDAQNLAFYWLWFAVDTNEMLDSPRRVPTPNSAQEEQFQKTRKRYETDQRPFLWHDKPSPDNQPKSP